MCCQSEIISSNNKTLNARLLAETQVCHRSYIIAARNNSTNLMVYGETGRYSIYINTKLRTVQSVTITTKVVSSTPVHGEVYSIQHYVIKFVSDLRQVGGFLRYPPPIKLHERG
jgi:hypothetical protein